MGIRQPIAVFELNGNGLDAVGGVNSVGSDGAYSAAILNQGLNTERTTSDGGANSYGVSLANDVGFGFWANVDSVAMGFEDEDQGQVYLPGWRLYMTGSGIVGTLRVKIVGTSIVTREVVLVSGWHYFSASIDSDGNGQVYVDGVAVGSPASTGASVNTETAIQSSQYGKLDQFTIGPAYSESEWSYVYNSGAGREYSDWDIVVPATIPSTPSLAFTSAASGSLTFTGTSTGDGGSALTAWNAYIKSGTTGELLVDVALEGKVGGDWNDATGNFTELSASDLVAAPVGYGLPPGENATGSQALIPSLSSPWWISCWRTISAGTIDSDDTVFGITLNEADGTVFDSYLAVLASGNQFQFFTAGGGNSGVFTIASAGEHLFCLRVYLSGPTLMGQLYVDGIAAGSPFAITFGSGGPEGCTFANGLAGSGDNPLLYSIWGRQGAATAAMFAALYNNGPRTYARRNLVKRNTGSPPSSTLVITTDANGAALANGTTYHVQATDENAVGESALSSEATGVPANPATIPEAIDDLFAQGGTGNSITLTWTAPDDGGAAITKYTLYLNGVLHTDNVTSPKTVTPLTIGVSSGPWTVTATNSEGESDPSNAVSATPGVPAAIADLANIGVTANTVHLDWSQPSDSGSQITSYKIYKGGVLNATVLAPTTDYLVFGLSEETSYAFTVVAVNARGSSAASNQVTATTVASSFTYDTSRNKNFFLTR